MNGRLLTLWAVAAGLTLLALSFPVAAFAGGCGCTPPPPPCCRPPSPPPPPSHPCCGSGANNIIVPGVNVFVGASVIVNANASAVVNASASATGSGSGTGTGTGTGSGSGSGTGNGSGVVVVGGGGGGSSWYSDQGQSGYIQGLSVDSGLKTERVSYQASRTKIRTVVIQAVCLDDKDVPHPASQLSPDRELTDRYEGEIYRCIAGARMQVTVADYSGKVDFDHGQTFTCTKSDALVLSKGPDGGPGRIECKPQKPARDCNERSLLRRFGAGVKILKIVSTETYTAYREEQTQTASSASSSFNMSIDGGVGGVAH